MQRQLQLGRREASACALVDGAVAIGWLRSGIIGFGGFEDHEAARRAGEAAALEIRNWSATRSSRWPAPLDRHVSEADAIKLDGAVVGRVLEPAPGMVDIDGLGIELSVPAPLWLAVMLTLAQRLRGPMDAVQSAGVVR